MRKISINQGWDPRTIEPWLERARIFDESGGHTIWINEGFGHDAFTGLAILARETSHVRLGTAVVNVYSRTAGTLAQSFATIDQLSGGRATAGLGASGNQLIERFHGMPFQPAITRVRETAELIQAFWSQERVEFEGRTMQAHRFKLGVEPVQPKIPIFLATLHPEAVRMTAEVADGWLPTMIPLSRLAAEVSKLRSHAEAAGRGSANLTIQAPSAVTVVENKEAASTARRQAATQLAFFVARNGDFYYRQFQRQGFPDEAEAIRRAWVEDGPQAAAAILSEKLVGEFNFVGTVNQCMERLDAQAEAGVGLHGVSIPEQDPVAFGRIVERLAG